MINQIEIPIYLEQAIPEISAELPDGKKRNASETMNALIEFMCKNIKAHNFGVVKRCLRLVDKLYTKGNRAVRNAIENVFVFSFTRLFLIYPDEKQQLMAIIPMTLYTLYIEQVCHRGC